MKTIPLLILPVVFITLLSCGSDDQTQNTAKPGLQVDALIARQQSLVNDYRTTAEIRAFEQVEIKAPVAGNVLDINFEEGQKISKNASIIRIDDRTWKAQAQGIKASLDALKKDRERKQALLKIEGSTQEELDNLEGQILSLEAQLNELQVKIDLANVKAPISGQLGLRNFSSGSFLAQGETITTLAQLDKLKVDFSLPDRYSNQLRTGKKVRVLIGNDSLEATIYAIEPVIEVNSRTIQARAILQPSASQHIIPGTYAEVLFPMESPENVIVLPTQVIVPTANAQNVFVYRQGKVELREVTLGTRNSQHCEILSGINPGDTIIRTGLLQISNGMEVQLNPINTGE